MMLEVWRELNSGQGPVHLKMYHLDESTISEIESILFDNERPSREISCRKRRKLQERWS